MFLLYVPEGPSIMYTKFTFPSPISETLNRDASSTLLIPDDDDDDNDVYLRL
jgi:hypothetical protein